MSNNGDNNGSSPELVIAAVALVVSVVALIGTVLQVLQQYFASAAGYSNCGEKVIGEWHKSKGRKFRWDELRFEVRFQAPVIFVCPPLNRKGPVKDAEVWHIDGTEKSLTDTRTQIPSAEDQAKRASAEKSLHTADNEQATWVVLLQELQRMERESQEWQSGQYNRNPPRQAMSHFQNHTLCVALQAKKRTWDTMPDNIKKPYATTTMCHLVEMAAMLGIYWQEFDRSKDKYRAEGNGYVLMGSHVADLGIMFTLQICGQSRFEDNRIIPADEIKELAFGVVSTIFRDSLDKRRLVFPTDEPKDLSILQLGSVNEFAETLVSFGCNTNTSNCIRSGTKRHGHLFPLAFEILGMLGKTLHLRDSCFRLVPNPTFYIWDKKYFSMRQLLREYKNKIMDDDLITINSTHVDKLQRLAEKVDAKLSAQRKKKGEDGISLELLDALHEALDACDEYLSQEIRQQVVEIVLRQHIQEVLKMVNNEDGYEDTMDTDEINGEANDSGSTRRQLRYNDLMTASPEEKQKKFMDLYFAVILPEVVSQTTQALQRAKSTALQVPHHHPHGSASSAGSAPTPSRSTTPADNHPAPPAVLIASQSDDLLTTHQMHRQNTNSTHITDRQATDVWCTLVFRMLCWLLLHDFHKKDVQKAKSELLGSRLPVYIA